MARKHRRTNKQIKQRKRDEARRLGNMPFAEPETVDTCLGRDRGRLNRIAKRLRKRKGQGRYRSSESDRRW